MVAMLGWIIPEPFAIPPILIVAPPTWDIKYLYKDTRFSEITDFILEKSSSRTVLWQWYHLNRKIDFKETTSL